MYMWVCVRVFALKAHLTRNDRLRFQRRVRYSVRLLYVTAATAYTQLLIRNPVDGVYVHAESILRLT